MRILRTWMAVLRIGLLALLPAAAYGQEAPLIAAASDLQFALTEIAADFRSETGLEVRLTFGSSGNLARQIQQGAPFQMFLSADEQFVFDLADKGLTRDRGALYAIGHIVLFAHRDSPLAARLSAQGLREALAGGVIKRFAIANPEHAPYGRAAQQWLERQGLWDALSQRLALGENASQAAQFAASGSCEAGIIPYSLALVPRIGEAGRFLRLPADEHSPVRQRMTLLASAGAQAERFYRYMQGPAARRVMRRHGFELPGEEP